MQASGLCRLSRRLEAGGGCIHMVQLRGSEQGHKGLLSSAAERALMASRIQTLACRSRRFFAMDVPVPSSDPRSGLSCLLGPIPSVPAAKNRSGFWWSSRMGGLECLHPRSSCHGFQAGLARGAR